MALKKKKNEWTYHTSHSFVGKDGNEYSAITQLYQIDVYMIVNSNPAMQMCLTPKAMVKLEKKFKRDEKKGIIKNLSFGREITVIEDNDGFFIEKSN